MLCQFGRYLLIRRRMRCWFVSSMVRICVLWALRNKLHASWIIVKMPYSMRKALSRCWVATQMSSQYARVTQLYGESLCNEADDWV